MKAIKFNSMHSIVYLAQSTKDQFAGTKEYEGFIKLVENSGYKVEILQATEDFYCRDYIHHRMSRNFLLDEIGDSINTILAATGFNL